MGNPNHVPAGSPDGGQFASGGGGGGGGKSENERAARRRVGGTFGTMKDIPNVAVKPAGKKKMARVSVTRPIGYTISDVGPGGKLHNTVTHPAPAGTPGHQHADGTPIPGAHGGANAHIPKYNPTAVNQAIAASNRAGRHIGGKEARAIHRLLKGRHG